MTDRNAIIAHISGTGLADRCLVYQTRYEKDPFLREEITQELWLWLLTYDIEKLSDAYENKHLNALITRFLQNQLFSKNSDFFYRYRRVSEERQTKVPIETLYGEEGDEDYD